MTLTTDVGSRNTRRPATRAIHVGERQIPVLGPSIRDPRIHLAFTSLSIITIGVVWLDFRLSVPQLLAAMISCGVLEVVRTYRADGMIVWPASALQTATSTALILRVAGSEAHDYWSFNGWYYFAGIAVAGVLTKYFIRYQGRHIFNPSNVALVAAFLIFGADRIEPLDFWWGPFGWAMTAAYAVIFVGGFTLCRRLELTEMALAYWATLAAGVGVLAILGQSITTQWSLTPISGAHYWWILVTSPETLIFLFFMITDPRTTPVRRMPRIAFGCAVGVMSTVLLAPWATEFGTKVGLLSGLVVVCAARSALHKWGNGIPPPRLRPVTALAGVAVIVVVIALAGIPNRSASAPEPPAPGVAFDIDPATLPSVSIDPEVAGLSAELATPAGAQDLAAALAFNLQVEAEAIMTGDASLLDAVDHGNRLDDLRIAIEQASGGDRVVPTYRFDTLHLSIVYPGGAQHGANAGLAATGVLTLTIYSAGGEYVDTTDQSIDVMFALRKLSSGRWLTTDTPSQATAE
jgi:Na+-translocating ferredoxin:NAD+ oxidoreductase RnfD subunit